MNELQKNSNQSKVLNLLKKMSNPPPPHKQKQTNSNLLEPAALGHFWFWESQVRTRCYKVSEQVITEHTFLWNIQIINMLSSFNKGPSNFSNFYTSNLHDILLSKIYFYPPPRPYFFFSLSKSTFVLYYLDFTWS